MAKNQRPGASPSTSRQPPKAQPANDPARSFSEGGWGTAERVIGIIVATATAVGFSSFLAGFLILLIYSFRVGDTSLDFSTLVAGTEFFGIAGLGAPMICLALLFVALLYLEYERNRRIAHKHRPTESSSAASFPWRLSRWLGFLGLVAAVTWFAVFNRFLWPQSLWSIAGMTIFLGTLVWARWTVFDPGRLRQGRARVLSLLAWCFLLVIVSSAVTSQAALNPRAATIVSSTGVVSKAVIIYQAKDGLWLEGPEGGLTRFMPMSAIARIDMEKQEGQ